MQIVETTSEGLTRGFKITVEASEISARQEDRLTDLGRQANIAGFRPGKVPLKILKQRFGQAVLTEVLEAAVQEATQKTLEERGLRAATQPKIEAEEFGFQDNEDFRYELTVEVLPDVETDDFSTYEIERLVVAPSDDDVAAAIERIAAEHQTTEPVTEARPAAAGDIAVIDFRGRVDGAEFDGGSGEGYPLELGSGRFIPGFEEQIIGQPVGQPVDVTVTFPDDYPTPELAGKEAVFSCEIKELKKVVKPEINDDFAVSLGLGSLAALQSQAKAQLEHEFARVARDKCKRQLLDKLAENHQFDVPPSMLEGEFNSIWEQIEAARARGDLDPEDASKSDEDLRAEYNDIALRRVRLGLLLSEVGQRNGITVSAEETNRALMQLARQHPGHEQELIERYRQSPEAMQQIQAPLFEDKVVDFMLEMVKLVDRPATRDELYAVDSEPDTAAATAKKESKAKKAAKTGKKPSADKKSLKEKKPSADKKPSSTGTKKAAGSAESAVGTAGKRSAKKATAKKGAVKKSAAKPKKST